MGCFFKNMRRITLVLLVGCALTACSGNNNSEKDNQGMKENQKLPTAQTEYALLEDLELEWMDNSKDSYTATVNLLMNYEKATGQRYGIGHAVFGENAMIMSGIHGMVLARDNYSSLSIVTDDGRTKSVKLELGLQTDAGLQVNEAGFVAGTDHVVVHTLELQEDGALRNLFGEIDENQKLVQTFYIDYIPVDYSWQIDEMALDGNGNLHLRVLSSGENLYYVFSQAGELLFEKAMEMTSDGGNTMLGLVPLYGNQVAVEICVLGQKNEMGSRANLGHSLWEADLETGKWRELLFWESNYSKTDEREDFVTLLDDNTLLVSKPEKGIYQVNFDQTEEKLLYLWANHGISPMMIKRLWVKENGNIGVYYADSSGGNYLVLKPTEEQVEIKTITLAVSESNKYNYLQAVANFNKKYPALNIVVKSDYDETALLTQLISGDGPVLVDTALTGFEEVADLWQPLDGILEQMGYLQDLNAKAMELGKIDGTLYGIITGFGIRTLAVTDENLKDWDYKYFLEYIDRHGEI